MSMPNVIAEMVRPAPKAKTYANRAGLDLDWDGKAHDAKGSKPILEECCVCHKPMALIGRARHPMCWPGLNN